MYNLVFEYLVDRVFGEKIWNVSTNDPESEPYFQTFIVENIKPFMKKWFTNMFIASRMHVVNFSLECIVLYTYFMFGMTNFDVFVLNDLDFGQVNYISV